jgi:hypothetical protein
VTRSVKFTAFDGHLVLRQLHGQAVALTVVDVPSLYADPEVLTIIRALEGTLPEGGRVPWNEAIGIGLQTGALAFESSGPARATGRRFLKRA